MSKRFGRLLPTAVLLAAAAIVLAVALAAPWRQKPSDEPHVESTRVSEPTTDLTTDALPLIQDALPEDQSQTRDPSPASGIVFESTDAGIDFRYFNSDDPATPGARMYEFTGGGVGALDYDLDGRVDLYWTQGCPWPPNSQQGEYLDRLYQNDGDRFRDVTIAAMIRETGFSQGLAVGDVDGDGFDDLYIANIGLNRLYLNNGDGTFRDATDAALPAAGLRVDAWTTSVAIADLNADGLPDLFDVNYVEGHDVFERICDHDGVPRICSPTMFAGQPDRLLLNRGDGTFTDITSIAGIDGAEGTGLGLVVADFDDSGRLGIFVGNDARNNHFYTNATPSPGDLPRFVEQAEQNGTAYDRDGRAQACMGIAAGDADGDGRLDLFITNYVEESNTLYLGDASGLFRDESRAAGLTQPSLKLLGFGTQFLDADLDGWEDLVLANGHVDDFTHAGYDHAMRPQFFHNRGGSFVELRENAAGAYFAEKRLGRGLARLDWNADGRDDFAVSHLGGPAELLTNATVPAGHCLRLKLIATRSARDAIGATAIVETHGRRLVRRLSTGDGYQAANERVLTFGLGTSQFADRLTIRWPSGDATTIEHVAADCLWLAVEGQPRPRRLARFERDGES